ncbi:MAG: 4-hydroxy-tetrahydrodipicolinate reductase [Crocinitomicaceae bacterium]|nr:4-hydroxy-tetrahydrodipicolinate reductase [Crocinitomicaceae bacterium]
MNIALVGYGKMGKAIEEIAVQRGHTIVAKINRDTPLDTLLIQKIDVAIEFTRPDVVVNNLLFCLKHHLPVVVGTTAWYDDFNKVVEQVKQENGALLYASNFSIGVNIFFEINRKLAQLMNPYTDYKAAVEEIHHLQKLDAPSGTAVTIANTIIENNDQLSTWKLGEETHPTVTNNELGITSYRKPDVPGTHIVTYQSDIDTIEIKHEAHNRKGFALGAVMAAEYLFGKKGIFTMSDVLNSRD